jgi:DNA (cytosine-5)-methyltransferase 1
VGVRYLSVCSGIEAASVAWEPLGWEPVAFSEIEDFPNSVLAERFPDVPNLGEMVGGIEP